MKKIYITEEQKDMIGHIIKDYGLNRLMLNEENRTQKKKCVEIITNNCNPRLRRLLDYKLVDLPHYLRQGLNPEGALYQAVSTNTNGCDKFIDYLRLNLYSQFSIGRHSLLTQYIPGIARIACVDCHFYAFDHTVDGGKVIKFARVLKLIQNKPDFMLQGVSLDSDFNGMSYVEFMHFFNDRVKSYVKNINRKLSSDEFKIVKTSEYDIIPIPDKIVSGYGSKVLRPTTEGRRILNNFGRYVDWCVCNNQYADEEYSQYLCNGDKMYICAKHGYKNIMRPATTETPLDEYGLSLICVIVGEDGLPTNVTTRYNHDFGGENHSDMWEATHLQKILNVNFREVFKPRSKKEVESLLMNENTVPTAQDQVKNKVNAGIMDAICGMVGEGAEPESNEYTIGSEGGNNDYFHVINEEKNADDIKTYTEQIANFMKENGLNVYPFPELELNWGEQDGLFITTGYYLPSDKKIVLFCKDRHPKDILRSYAHEMIHHMQNLDGQNMNFSSKDDVKDNKKLEKLESEAYLKGNIYFRKWTEYERSNNVKKHLNESPDRVEIANINFEDECARPFLIFKGFPEDPIIGVEGRTHSDLIISFLDDVEECPETINPDLINAIETKQIRPILTNAYEVMGRYFDEVELPWAGKIISVYDYTRSNLKKIGQQLIPVIEKLKNWGLVASLQDIDFDDWIGNKPFRYPFSWLLNGLAEIYVDAAESLQRDKTDERSYTFIGKSGVSFKLDAKGNVIERNALHLAENIIYEPKVDESLTPDEVDLSSFNIKKNLNPKFWKDGRLDSRIRIKLLDIADDFIDFLGVDWVKPEDITITGSLANFNWDKKHSDIDLHILMDYSKVDERVDFVDRYFYSLKELWNEEHKDLKIFGFPIEVFVQDTKKEHTSSGVYSLEKDKWLEEPEREKLSKQKVNKNKIKNAVSKYTKKIDVLYERSKEMKTDEYKARKVYEDAEKLFDEIKNLRRKDLSNSGNEINEGNIIFKCLRRLGYIEKLDSIINKGYDAFNSLS